MGRRWSRCGTETEDSIESTSQVGKFRGWENHAQVLAFLLDEAEEPLTVGRTWDWNMKLFFLLLFF